MCFFTFYYMNLCGAWCFHSDSKVVALFISTPWDSYLSEQDYYYFFLLWWGLWNHVSSCCIFGNVRKLSSRRVQNFYFMAFGPMCKVIEFLSFYEFKSLEMYFYFYYSTILAQDILITIENSQNEFFITLWRW